MLRLLLLLSLPAPPHTVLVELELLGSVPLDCNILLPDKLSGRLERSPLEPDNIRWASAAAATLVSCCSEAEDILAFTSDFERVER